MNTDKIGTLEAISSVIIVILSHIIKMIGVIDMSINKWYVLSDETYTWSKNRRR